MTARSETFTVYPGKEAQNCELGEQLRVLPAKRAATRQTIGVAIFVGGYLKFVLEEAHAISLANSIADALEGKNL